MVQTTVNRLMAAICSSSKAAARPSSSGLAVCRCLSIHCSRLTRKASSSISSGGMALERLRKSCLGEGVGEENILRQQGPDLAAEEQGLGVDANLLL